MAPIAESSRPLAHDYTEGASPIDIRNAMDNNRRSRRDSQYSTVYGQDGEGAMFSGPGHSVNPTSVSRMSVHETGRRSSEYRSFTRRKSHDSERSSRWSRRLSKDSQVSRQSIEHAENLGGDMLLGNRQEDITQDRQISSTNTAGVFSGLAHLFRRTSTSSETPGCNRSLSRFSYASTSRRSRRSRRSDTGDHHALEDEEEDEVERWGYSSGEEDSESGSIQSMAIDCDEASITPSMEYDSDPPTTSGGTYGIPLMSTDPIFGGEARIDMEVPFEDHKPPPPGPPSRQTVYIADEDCTIRFIGYEPIMWRILVWKACCIMTFGILGLLGHWFPRLWLRWVAQEKAFINSKNGLVVIEVGCMLRFI
ncbi:hypothetical protein C0989_002535 [Termitomyces sp. Mn162]|nr:hypothetical protein C0989_002535 [Termitomyces sp. Mn162]